MRVLPLFVATFALIFFTFGQGATSPHKAPEWDISEWINGEGVSLDDLKGQVVIVEFFQLWCPGCNKFSIPLMKKWGETVFKGEIESGKLKLISIHTVFEGHNYQTPERLRSFVKEKGIRHLVGIDRHLSGSRLPETMKIYQTRGTPEMAIIDKKGNLRFQIFGGFDAEAATKFLRELLKEPAV